LRESQTALEKSHSELLERMRERTSDLHAMTRLQKIGTLFAREGNLEAVSASRRCGHRHFQR